MRLFYGKIHLIFLHVTIILLLSNELKVSAFTTPSIRLYKHRGHILRASLVQSNVKFNKISPINHIKSQINDVIINPVRSFLQGLHGKDLLKVFGLIAVLCVSPRTAFATAKEMFYVNAKGRGWDIYGRVPYDDFLFKTSSLLDPNLLKMSIVEAVGSEVPYTMAHFRRKKRITEVLGFGKAWLTVAVSVVCFGYLLKVTIERGRAKYLGDAPLSAINKKSLVRGKKIDFMGEGWYDMELMDDEPETNDTKGKKKPDDDDDDKSGKRK